MRYVWRSPCKPQKARSNVAKKVKATDPATIMLPAQLRSMERDPPPVYGTTDGLGFVYVTLVPLADKLEPTTGTVMLNF